MPRAYLTESRVYSFTCPMGKSQDFLWDTSVKGLGVRALPGSRYRVYVFQYQRDGRTVRLTLGDTRTWSLDSANDGLPSVRDEVARLRTLVKGGVNVTNENVRKVAA